MAEVNKDAVFLFQSATGYGILRILKILFRIPERKRSGFPFYE